MPKRTKPLPQFTADDEPYSVAVVTLQIRVLGDSVSRSRLTVNIHPEPRLASAAKKTLGPDQYGKNENGDFVVNLSQNFNAWADMNNGFPLLDERLDNAIHREDAKAMNQCIIDSVSWILELHKKVKEGPTYKAKPKLQ